MKRRRPIAPATVKRRRVLEQYDALLPEGQRAVDLVLVALPRRPVSEVSPSSELEAAVRARRRV